MIAVRAFTMQERECSWIGMMYALLDQVDVESFVV